MKRSELKLYARRALRGNYGTMAGSMFIYMGLFWILALIFGFLFSLFFGGSIYRRPSGIFLIIGVSVMVLFYLLICVVTTLLSAGFSRLYLTAAKGRRPFMGEMFWAFTHKPGKFILISMLLALFLVLSIAPLALLGAGAAMSDSYSAFVIVFFVVYLVAYCILVFYLSLTFSQFYLILVEDPDKGIFQALKESRRLMIGNRFRFLMLELSFIGMELLGVLTEGIGYLWIVPYINCTTAMFYLSLKNEVPPELMRSGQTPPRGGYGYGYGSQSAQGGYGYWSQGAQSSRQNGYGCGSQGAQGTQTPPQGGGYGYGAAGTGRGPQSSPQGGGYGYGPAGSAQGPQASPQSGGYGYGAAGSAQGPQASQQGGGYGYGADGPAQGPQASPQNGYGAQTSQPNGYGYGAAGTQAPPQNGYGGAAGSAQGSQTSQQGGGYGYGAGGSAQGPQASPQNGYGYGAAGAAQGSQASPQNGYGAQTSQPNGYGYGAAGTQAPPQNGYGGTAGTAYGSQASQPNGCGTPGAQPTSEVPPAPQPPETGAQPPQNDGTA